MYNPSLWFDIRVYLAVIAGLLMVIAFYNCYAGLVGIIIWVAMYKYSRERHLNQKKELSEYLTVIEKQVEEVTDNALKNLPLGVAVINDKGVVRWSNSVLAQWLDQEINLGDSFLSFFPDNDAHELLKKIWQAQDKEKVLLKHNLRTYCLEHKIAFSGNIYFTEREVKETEPPGKLLILYLTDVTEKEFLQTENLYCRPVMGYIQIDNYDDALKGVTEHQRSAILSKVNEHLVDWIAEIDGFLKKLSEDIYVAVFDRRALDKLMHGEKFEILDKVRTIHGGNKIPLTLSMGITAGAMSISSLNQAARTALEVALGRGGDQAAIEIDGKFKFYGGNSQAIEKNTRVRARIVAHIMRELIEQADTCVIMGHNEEDFDSLGAAMGLYCMVRHAGKKAHIVISTKGVAANKLAELLVDYKDYGVVFVTPENARGIINNRTLLFIVDTHRPELVAAPELLDVTTRRVIIDHHRRAETFIENPLLVYLEPSASSASELVTELLSYFSDKLELMQAEATTLYAGIVLDTKKFMVQTGVRTFEAASYLRRAGADLNLVKNLFKMDFESIKFRSAIISNTEMPLPGIAISICPQLAKDNQHLIAAQSADVISNLEGILASFVLYETDGEIGISARSQGFLNVQVILENFGGGGHQTAAGARVREKSVNEVKTIIIETVAKYLQESVKENESNSQTGH